MTSLSSLLLVAASYLLGAVPFGLLFSNLFSGVDVRTVGSRNIGATNVLRSAGKTAAILTLVADMLKGVVPVVAARHFFADDAITAFAGAAAILGHNFPVYLGFKGGKGVATGFGVMLGVTPLVGLICLLTWLGTAYFWRYSSLSALCAFAACPVLTIALYPQSRFLGALSLFIASLIYVRHRENINRLLSGTEPKIGRK